MNRSSEPGAQDSALVQWAGIRFCGRADHAQAIDERNLLAFLRLFRGADVAPSADSLPLLGVEAGRFAHLHFDVLCIAERIDKLGLQAFMGGESPLVE